jgi:8-oxo-dGTP diphosphatase
MSSTVPDGAIHVVAAALRNPTGEILVAQRPPHKHQGGLWEFPGGKVEPGESPRAALARELEEELGVVITDARPLIRIDHDYGDRRVLLDVWAVTHWQGEPRGHEGQPLQWVGHAALASLPMPAADAPIVTALRLPDRYLVTPEPLDARAWLARLTRRLERGESLIQLRAKSLQAEEYEALARQLLSVAGDGRRAQILLNAPPELVMRIGADGVHLSSARLRACDRRPLPAGKWVAASCHDLDELRQAERIGCDFAVVGPVKVTASHPGAEPIGWQGVRAIADRATIPVYGIGGLSACDIDDAWQNGAQGIAAINGLWFDAD